MILTISDTKMSRFIIRPATSLDNASLCELAHSPILGQVSLSLEQHPNYFVGAGIKNETVEIYICRDKDREEKAVGMFSIGKRNVYIDRQLKEIRYFSDLRIAPEYQGSRLLFSMNEHLRKLGILRPGEFFQTMIFEENSAIEELIRKKRPEVLRRLNLPTYHPFGKYHLYIIGLGKKRAINCLGIKIRRATLADIPAMQHFFERETKRKLCYPSYNFSQLERSYYQGLTIGDYFLAYRGDELVGITGTWDQRAFKQTRVVGYEGSLKWGRPILNLVSQSLTGFRLPPVGEQVNGFYLHTLVIQENNPLILQALTEHIYQAYQETDFDFFVTGLFENDSLTKSFDSFTGKRIIEGKHYLITFDEQELPFSDQECFYLEAARI